MWFFPKHPRIPSAPSGSALAAAFTLTPTLALVFTLALTLTLAFAFAFALAFAGANVTALRAASPVVTDTDGGGTGTATDTDGADAAVAEATQQMAIPALDPFGEKEKSGDPIFVMETLTVSGKDEREELDPTGMGGPDAEMTEAPFSNELLASAMPYEDEVDVAVNTELQLAAASTTNPADVATTINRANLIGFPTPILRNGFTQTGVPEVLNAGHTEVWQGPFTPVTGRAAPGGIRNLVTNRPGRGQLRLYFYGNDTGYTQARVDCTSELVPKKIWQRVAIDHRLSDSPVEFAYYRITDISGGLTWRVNRKHSVMLNIDHRRYDANTSSGIPHYRETITTVNDPNLTKEENAAANIERKKIIGPYLPLADFNSYGPDALTCKRISSASLQYEGSATRRLTLRGNLQAWRRDLWQDRFYVGQYLLDTGRYSGTREPFRIEQPMDVLTGTAEATYRLALSRSDHKITFRVEHIQTAYSRIDRYLDRTDKDAGGLTARDRYTHRPGLTYEYINASGKTAYTYGAFDPRNPDYYFPTFTPDLYTYRNIDRDETTAISSAALSERLALWRGKLVATTAVRHDHVELSVDNHPSAGSSNITSYAEDTRDEITWLAGANYQVLPRRLLVFANTSTAFEPCTRVDGRTGEIQGNETTLGYELGLRGMLLKRIGVTALFFQYENKNIARGNPLYNDPEHDADHTQPQLVSAGKERFTGGTLSVKGVLGYGFEINLRAAYTRAITLASPDRPEQVGREIARLPPANAALSTTYRAPAGKFKGYYAVLTVSAVSDYIAYYDDNKSRAYLDYPANTQFSLGLGRSWTVGKPARGKRLPRHSFYIGISNLMNRDQLNRFARLAQGRRAGMSYSLVY
ncbi:MAG: TonB-dependent receptor [Opitutaceae bacterium]|jgi:iron complex outermembrane receptor protein|nr:TonB-dependent receptor [Opitutaceae bacterium]